MVIGTPLGKDRFDGFDRVGSYSHLEPPCIEIDMHELARIIVGENYGTHRILSEIAVIRLDMNPDDSLALSIVDLLEAGLY